MGGDRKGLKLDLANKPLMEYNKVGPKGVTSTATALTETERMGSIMAERIFACVACGAQATAKATGPLPSLCEACKPRRRTRDELHASAACRQQRICKVCGGTFTPKHADRTKCCSRQCGVKWAGHALNLRNTGGRVWVRKEMGRTKPVQGPPLPRMCECGCFIMVKQARACEPCRSDKRSAARRAFRQSAVGRECKKAHRKAGKARKRGVTAEVVIAFNVLQRDGWRCQLCGAKTPKSLRGTYDLRAPEVDHIIPIAAGGEHSYRNTQCACRKCNLAKAGRPLGQMRLF